MSEYGTIHLNTNVAPGDKDWHQGYISKQSDGVNINGNRDWRGQTTFYPWHQVQKIEYR